MDFIAKLKELTEQEDVLAVSRDVNELRSKFEDYVLEEERKFQVAQLEAEEKGEAVQELDTDFGKEAFYEIYGEYKNRRKAIIDERNAVESANLGKKNTLLKKLKETVTSEENIGAAFSVLKEVQEEWKEIGPIPRDKRNDIQKEYSRLMEDFFYNINIYKQLKDHDFRRNHQLKVEIIEKLKALQKEESIKKMETELKDLQDDWEDVGPVPNEEWELMKESYWTEVRSLYNRINRFYEDRRDQQNQNLEKKQALVVEVRELAAGTEELEGTKDWDKKTNAIIELQAKWKTIGFGPKKENEEVWKEFRAVCDEFFAAKKEFFGKLNDKFDAIASKKKALVDQALELKDSTDWKDTSMKLINLQKQWKKHGHAGRRNEQKLWKDFRGACDHFFNAKQKFFEEKDAQNEGNLTAKRALIAKMEAYSVGDDREVALADLKQFSADFNAIGHVPIKFKDEVYDAFRVLMDKHYGALKMEGLERERILFQAKIDTMKASPNAGRLFRDAKGDLRKEIEKQQKEISLLENNLGFFSSSKGADSLKKDVERKVQRAQEKIKVIREKIKMIPNE